MKIIIIERVDIDYNTGKFYPICTVIEDAQEYGTSKSPHNRIDSIKDIDNFNECKIFMRSANINFPMRCTIKEVYEDAKKYLDPVKL